jgi:hypothetical protein
LLAISFIQPMEQVTWLSLIVVLPKNTWTYAFKVRVCPWLVLAPKMF